MTLKNTEIGLKINIDDTLLGTLVGIGKQYYPNEFGGFLIGNYSEDSKVLYITDTILPNTFKASKYLFERSTDGIDFKFEKFYAESPQKYYVGEWHTHPDSSPIPSNTDIKAMKTIVNHDQVSIKNPVLLIIGYDSIQVNFGFYVSFENKLYRYEQ